MVMMMEIMLNFILIQILGQNVIEVYVYLKLLVMEIIFIKTVLILIVAILKVIDLEIS